jgi:hypothetical protein
MKLWKVETVRHKGELAARLNALTHEGFEIVYVFSEGGHDGYDFTIIARQR